MEGYDHGTKDGLPLRGLASEKRKARAFAMNHDVSLFKAICFTLTVYIGACLTNFSALAHTEGPFPYDFGSEKLSPPSQDSNRSGVAFAINPDAGNARGDNMPSLADSAMPQQIDVQGDAHGGANGFDAPVDSLRSLSLSQTSEPIVPEPSTILGGIAAAGLMLAFLVRRWRHKCSSAAET